MAVAITPKGKHTARHRIGIEADNIARVVQAGRVRVDGTQERHVERYHGVAGHQESVNRTVEERAHNIAASINPLSGRTVWGRPLAAVEVNGAEDTIPTEQEAVTLVRRVVVASDISGGVDSFGERANRRAIVRAGWPIDDCECPVGGQKKSVLNEVLIPKGAHDVAAGIDPED